MAARSKTKAEAEGDALVLRDAATLKALADPMRLQILMELADEPRTVKDVAAVLEVGPTRLYYHFKMLERARLIRVAGRRMVSGIEERSYQATATSWTPAAETTPALVESGVIRAMLKLVQAELELALRAQSATPLGEPGSPVPILSLTRLALSDAEVAEVQKRIEGIMLDYTPATKHLPKGKKLYGALFTGYQMPSELGERRTETSGKEE